jgi:geranylgeranyl reductase family protein
MNVEHYDVGVVGAGPAGSSAAFSLARRGYSVLLIDKCFFPRDKLCGDFISPINWPLFEWLGVVEELLSLEHEKITAFRISSSSGEEATFHFPLNEGRRLFGLGLSRFYLDHLLLKQAGRAGATIMQGTRVRDLEKEGNGWSITLINRSEESTLRLAFLIGADGRNSWVAHRLGLTNRRESSGRFLGFQLHLRGVKQPTGQVQIHLFPGGYAGLAGLGGGIANLCFTVERRRFNKNSPIEGILENCLYQNPRLKEILRNSELLGDVRSAYPIYFPPRKSFGDGFLLAGDAARVLEPVTGEGVYLALKSGNLAAETIHRAFVLGNHKAGYLASYERACNQCFSQRRRINQLIRTMLTHPFLLRPLIRLSSKTSFPLGPMINSVVQSSSQRVSMV